MFGKKGVYVGTSRLATEALRGGANPIPTRVGQGSRIEGFLLGGWAGGIHLGIRADRIRVIFVLQRWGLLRRRQTGCRREGGAAFLLEKATCSPVQVLLLVYRPLRTALLSFPRKKAKEKETRTAVLFQGVG